MTEQLGLILLWFKPQWLDHRDRENTIILVLHHQARLLVVLRFEHSMNALFWRPIVFRTFSLKLKLSIFVFGLQQV